MPKREPVQKEEFPSRPWVTSPATTGGGSMRRSSWAPTPSNLRAPAPTEAEEADEKAGTTKEERIANYDAVGQRWSAGEASPDALIDSAARADYEIGPVTNSGGVLSETDMRKYVTILQHIAKDEDNWLHTSNAGQLLLLIAAESIDEPKMLEYFEYLWKSTQQFGTANFQKAKGNVLKIVKFFGKYTAADSVFQEGGEFYKYVEASFSGALAKRNRHDLSSGGHGAVPRGGKEYPINSVFVPRFGEKHKYDPSAYAAIQNILGSKTAVGHGMQYSPEYRTTARTAGAGTRNAPRQRDEAVRGSSGDISRD